MLTKRGGNLNHLIRLEPPSSIGSLVRPILCGDHFFYWNEKILLILGCMDLDLVLHEDEPPIPKEL